LSLSNAIPPSAPFWLWQATQYVWTIGARLGKVAGVCANAPVMHAMDTASLRFIRERRVPGFVA
jgi:hypothetical protein